MECRRSRDPPPSIRMAREVALLKLEVPAGLEYSHVAYEGDARLGYRGAGERNLLDGDARRLSWRREDVACVLGDAE